MAPPTNPTPVRRLLAGALRAALVAAGLALLTVWLWDVAMNSEQCEAGWGLDCLGIGLMFLIAGTVVIFLVGWMALRVAGVRRGGARHRVHTALGQRAGRRTQSAARVAVAWLAGRDAARRGAGRVLGVGPHAGPGPAPGSCGARGNGGGLDRLGLVDPRRARRRRARRR